MSHKLSPSQQIGVQEVWTLRGHPTRGHGHGEFLARRRRRLDTREGSCPCKIVEPFRPDHDDSREGRKEPSSTARVNVRAVEVHHDTSIEAKQPRWGSPQGSDSFPPPYLVHVPINALRMNLGDSEIPCWNSRSNIKFFASVLCCLANEFEQKSYRKACNEMDHGESQLTVRQISKATSG